MPAIIIDINTLTFKWPVTLSAEQSFTKPTAKSFILTFDMPFIETSALQPFQLLPKNKC